MQLMLSRATVGGALLHSDGSRGQAVGLRGQRNKLDPWRDGLIRLFLINSEILRVRRLVKHVAWLDASWTLAVAAT